MTTRSRTLTPAELDAFGTELDAVRDEVRATLGERDAEYIRNVRATVRYTEAAGRGLLFLSFFPPAWVAGANRAQHVLETYPGCAHQDDAVALMGEAYTRVGNEQLAADVDLNAFAGDTALAAKTDYVPASYKDRILAASKLLGPRESDTVVFNAPTKPGRYPFVCSFPGHFQVGMKGELIVE